MTVRFKMTGACGRIAIVFLLSFLGPAAWGQTYVWTGSAPGNFSDPLNWNSVGVPINSPTSVIQINAVDPTSFTLTNDLAISPFVLNGFMLNSTSNGLITVASPDPSQLGGTAPNITMTGSGAFSIVSSTDGVVFDVANAMTIVGAGTGTLTIGGATDNDAFTGNGAINVNFSNIGTAAAPNLLLGNLGSWNGPLNIQSGYVKANRIAGDLFGETTIMTIAAGSTFDMSNNGETFGGLQGAGTLIMGSAGLTFDAPGDRTWSGSISGTGAVTQNNSSVLTFAGGTNTYSGGTTIQAGGTLRAAANNVLSPNSVVTVSVGQGTLDLNGFSQTVAGLAGGLTTSNLALGSSTLTDNVSGTRIFNGFLSGPGNLVVGGTGSQTFLGNNTYTGTTTINSGTLRIGGAPLASGAGVTIAAGGTLDANFGTDTTWTSPLSGAGNFTKSGAGALTFSAANGAANFSLVTINAGGIILNDASDNGAKLGSNPALTLGSGNVTLLGNGAASSTQSFNNITLSGGGKLNVITGSNQNASMTLGSITRNLWTTANFGFTNTGSGTASISTTSNNGATGILGGWATVNGTDWAVTGTGAGPFNVSPLPAASYTPDAWSTGAHVDISGTFATGAAGSVASARFNTPGASVLTLTGSNPITTGGVLVTPNVGANNVSTTGGTLTAPANQELIFQQFNAAGTLSIGSVVGNTAGTAVQETVATLGTTSTMNVPTTVGLFPGMILTAGTNIPATMNAHIVSINSPTQITISFKNDITGMTTPIGGTNIPVTFTPGTYVTKSGPGTMMLTGTNTFNGSLVLNEGTVSVGTLANLGASATGLSSSVIFNGGTLRVTGSISSSSGLQPYIFGPAGGTIEVANANNTHTKQGNSVSGSGPLTKTGPGILAIGSNASAYNGLVTVNNGVLLFTSNQFGNVSGMTVNPGGQYQVNDDAVGTFRLATTAVMQISGAGPSGSNTPGAFALTDQSPNGASPGGPVTTFSTALQLNGDSTVGTYNGNGGRVSSLIFSNQVTGSGNLLKTGNGMLTLSSAFNNYTGSTILSNGTLKIAGGDNHLPIGTTLQFGETGSTNAGTFDLNGFNQTVGGLLSTGSSTAHAITNSGANTPILTVNYSGSSPQTYAGQIGGTGTSLGLLKSGSGSLTLSGATTYTGPTTVTGGTLRVFSNTVSRPYTVADGASLSVVNPDPATPFAMSSLTLGTSGATNLGLELQGTAPATGVINVTDFNGLDTNGSVNLSLASAQSLSVGQFPLIKYSGTIGGAGFGAFTAGSLNLPSRVLGHLVDDAANSSIDLSITGVDFIKWTGSAGGNWNINQAQSWKLNSTNAPTTYLESPAPGDSVVFDETAAGTHTVNLTTTLTPSAVTVSGTSDYTFSGPGQLTGNTGITKSGNGTLTLLTNNTNTGATTINGGTVRIGTGGTTGAMGSGAVVDNGALIFDRSDDVISNANISGTGSLTKNGAGTLALTGGFSITGDTSINAGALALSGGAYSGNISGAGALNKTGVGTLVLTGNAAHTGGTNVSGGILQIGDGGTSGAISGTVNLAAGTTLQFNRADDSISNASITGGGGIRKEGAGTATIAGALSYTGDTFVNAGALELSLTSDFAYNQKLAGVAGSTFIKSGPGQLTLFNNNSGFVGNFIVNAGTVLLDDQGSSGDLNASSIVINNGGKFIFGNNNGIAGSNPDLPDSTFITVNTGGEFAIKIGEQWGATRLAGGTFRFSSNNTAVGATMNATSGPFVGFALESGTIIGETGTALGTMTGPITKTTSGTVNIIGKVSIPAASAIPISEGTLAFETGNVPTSGAGQITLGDFATVGTFRLSNAGIASSSRTFNINTGGGTIDIADPAGTLTLTNAMNGSGNLTKTGPGTLNIVPSFSMTGTTAVNQGTLRMGSGSAAGGFIVADGAKLTIANGQAIGLVFLPSLTLGSTSSNIDFEFNSVSNPDSPLLTILNPDGLLTSGGLHTLSVSNTQPLQVGEFPLISYTGNPITAGFKLGTLPSRTAASLVYNTQAFSIDLNVTGVDSTLWNGNASADWDAGTAVDVGGTKNFKLASNSAATNFIAGDRITFDDTAAGNFAVNLTTALQPSSVTVNNDANTYTFQGPGSITGTTGLTKQGAGTLIVQNENTYTGPTAISAGTIQIGNAGTTGSIASNIDIAAGATLSFNRSDSFAYNAKLSGSGDIAKTGAGTLTLGGSSTAFFGTLTVNQGTVLLDDLGAGGDLNAVSIVVNNGGSFVFGENGNADFPDTTVVTVNTGGVFDLKQGENFGGVLLKGGTFQMTGGTRTGTNATGAGSIGFVFESGTVTTNFTGPATGGVLSGTTFVNKTTPATVNITGGVTFADTVSLNILDGTLAMAAANLPIIGTTSIALGDLGTTGTLKIVDNGAASTIRPIVINDGGGTVELADPAGLLTFAGPISGTGTLTKIGAGTLVAAGVNTYTGPTVVNAGTLRVTSNIASSSAVTINTGGKFEATSNQTINALTINDGGKLVVVATAAAPRTIVTISGDAPVINGTGMIDLRNNALVFDYNSASPLQTIRTLIINGKANGWTAGPLPSIGSTEAAASSGNLVIGYGEASTLNLAGSFMGQAIDDTSVVVRLTLAGDADLDGTVGFSDLVAVAQHYGQSDGSATWNIGDFDYDGNVGFTDLVAVAQHYGVALPSSAIPGAPADFNADLAAAFASVPEPSAAAVLLIMTGGLVISRRHRN